MKFLQRVTNRNKAVLNKPTDRDVIYYSEFTEWDTSNAFRSFSIKYVLDQSISYQKDGRLYVVKANQYMVACKYADVKASFHYKSNIRSICIDICPKTVAEIFTILTDKKVDFDNYLDQYFKYPVFYESINSVYQTTLGKRLQDLNYEIQLHNGININKEWFIDLAERIIYQEFGNYLALLELNVVRPATKKEILRRLKLAKEYMDSNFLTITQIKEIAEYATMSEYHFLRCFKQVYKRTPYQYITEKRMQLAKSLLSKKVYLIREVANLCSFQDVYSFSKAFKKFYGISPSGLK
jgi:AraC-like DNA-binding protein